MIALIHHPEGEKRLGEHLVENLQKDEWTKFRAAVAFVKRSGVKHLAKPLKDFGKRGKSKISSGIDQGVTSSEGLTDLLAAVQPSGEVWVFHNDSPSNPTFHPKVYLFSNDNTAECFIGSGNLTEGGLFTNYEAFVHFRLDLEKTDDKIFFEHLEILLNKWSTPADGTALRLTSEVIQNLHSSGDLPSEVEIIAARNAAKVVTSGDSPAVLAKKLFASIKVKPAPRVILERKPNRDGAAEETESKVERPVAVETKGFVITLQNTDVGFGQKTVGAQRRSAELFIPKICVRSQPGFWGWPDLFKPDPGWRGSTDGDGFTKMDRNGVRMRLGTQVLVVNWWYNPDKRDYRLRHEALRSGGNVGDILRIELADGGTGFDYYGASLLRVAMGDCSDGASPNEN